MFDYTPAPGQFHWTISGAAADRSSPFLYDRLARHTIGGRALTIPLRLGTDLLHLLDQRTDANRAAAYVNIPRVSIRERVQLIEQRDIEWIDFATTLRRARRSLPHLR